MADFVSQRYRWPETFLRFRNREIRKDQIARGELCELEMSATEKTESDNHQKTNDEEGKCAWLRSRNSDTSHGYRAIRRRAGNQVTLDRKSTRLNSSHLV